MKTLIYSGFSDNNRLTAELTAGNKLDYARRHGYEVLTDNCPWEIWKVYGLQRIREMLMKGFDLVCCVGSDVLFMNHQISLESRICRVGVFASETPIYGLTIAEEKIRWWPINNDVAIWTKAGIPLLERLVADSPTWLEYPWLWQNHLWNLIQTEKPIRDSVEIVPSRKLNATHKPGESMWQLGDFILHVLEEPEYAKQRIIREFLPLAGEPTYYPKKK
jgi:hypothetical protein